MPPQLSLHHTSPHVTVHDTSVPGSFKRCGVDPSAQQPSGTRITCHPGPGEVGPQLPGRARGVMVRTGDCRAREEQGTGAAEVMCLGRK